MRLRLIQAAAIICGFMFASKAEACYIYGPPNEAETQDKVDQAVKSNDIVIVARVVTPMSAKSSFAIVRPVRVLKGSHQRSYRVVMATDCDGGISQDKVGRDIVLHLIKTRGGYGTPLIRQRELYERLMMSRFSGKRKH